MASTPQQVHSGDLITAEFMNGLLTVIHDLQTEIADLGDVPASKSVASITDLIPRTSILRVGDRLEIRGNNFDFKIGAHSIYFDEQRVHTFEDGSSDTCLVVTVPYVPNLVEAGTPVILVVTNRSTSASRVVKVRPQQQAQQGNISLIYQGSTPEKPLSGVNFSLNYRLHSEALFEDKVTVVPLVLFDKTTMRANVLDEQGRVVSDRVFKVRPGEDVNLSVQIAIPQNSDKTPFTVQTHAEAPQTVMLTSDTTAHEFTVNGDSETFEPTITTLLPSTVTPSEAVRNGTIRLKAGETVKIGLTLAFNVSTQTKYDVVLEIDPAGELWKAEPWRDLQRNTPESYMIDRPTTEDPGFKVTALRGSGATGPSKVRFSIIRRDTKLRKYVEFLLERI